MKTLRRLCTILGVLAITAAALGLVTVSAGSSIALASPAELAANMRPAAAPPPVRPFADPLPATTCTLVGQTRTCEVWAMEGTTTMPDGVVVTIWGFTDSATGTAELPGPTLVVSEGERVEVIFHNTLDQNVSLSFPGQAIFPPDLIGVGQGLSKTYAFTATNPGTYLYEAGLTPNGGRQVAMGLYGGFIVRPATAGQAYNDVVSAYDDEALLIFSEIDPAFNAAPMTFSMQDFSPQYWLINGQAFADTPNISTTAGSRVLLRMVNGGIDHRSISLLGLQQTIVGIDGVSLPITRTRTVVAESIGPGQAVDTIAAIPAGAQTGTLYTIFNGALQNHNADARLTDGSLAFGGMLTFIEITAGTAASDGGPVVTSAEAVPSPTAGDTDVELTFVISATNGGTVVAYRRAVGTVPSDAGTPLTPAPVVTVTEIVAAAELGLWDSDYYEFYVSGRDNDGVWGPVGSAILNLDKLGPDVVGLSLNPSPTNGTRDVMLWGTADDHSNGNGNVVGASYDLGNGSGPITMSLNLVDSPIVEVSALIPSADVLGLGEGAHTIAVVATDTLGNPGTETTITLEVDTTGPAAGSVQLAPGAVTFNGGIPSTSIIRMDALVEDLASNGVSSPLATAEAFIGGTGVVTDGEGIPLFPSDGLFDEKTEAVYYPIPATYFNTLLDSDFPDGVPVAVPVWVHGKDVAGNWGDPVSGTIQITRLASDYQGPEINGLLLIPGTVRIREGTTTTLTASASDPDGISNILRAEWYMSPDPGYGNGTPLPAADGAFDSPNEQLEATIDVSGWPRGGYIFVRAQDNAMNWGPSGSAELRVIRQGQATILSDSFDAGLDAWTNLANVTATPEANIAAGMAAQSVSAEMGMQALLADETPSYATLSLPVGERDIRLSFDLDPNGATLGADAVDILVGQQPNPLSPTPRVLFGIRMESQLDTAAGLQYEVQAWVWDDGVESATEWVHIPNDPVRLGLSWEAAAGADFELMVDGVAYTVPLAPDTSAYLLRELRLGPSVNAEEGTPTVAQYFDNFLLERALYVYLPLISK